MQTLNFIGRGNCFNTDECNTSAYYIKNKEMLLIDCGCTVMNEIENLELLSSGDITDIYILITHLHDDHVGSLGSLIFSCKIKYNMKVHIVSELNHSEIIRSFLKMVGVRMSLYDIHILDPFKCTCILPWLKIMPIHTPHVMNLESFGYYLEIKRDRFDIVRVYYSGDSNTIPQTIISKIRRDLIDEVYQDVELDSDKIDGDIAHLPISLLRAYITETDRHKVYCMHLSNNITKREELVDMGFNVVFLAQSIK